jgi:hypothetical protein
LSRGNDTSIHGSGSSGGHESGSRSIGSGRNAGGVGNTSFGTGNTEQVSPPYSSGAPVIILFLLWALICRKRYKQHPSGWLRASILPLALSSVTLFLLIIAYVHSGILPYVAEVCYNLAMSNENLWLGVLWMAIVFMVPFVVFYIVAHPIGIAVAELVKPELKRR